MQDVIDKILSCGFECADGPLDKSEDFDRLSRALSRLPEYHMGAPVDVHLKVTVGGHELEKWVAGVVTKITTKYTVKGNVFHQYQVSAGIPQKWYGPKVIAPDVNAAALRRRAVSS